MHNCYSSLEMPLHMHILCAHFSLAELVPSTVAKRSLDWGVRFGVKATVEDHLKNSYLEKDGLELTSENREKIKLSNFEKVQCGMIAGFVSGISTPLDASIAMTQKFDKKNRSSYQIIKSNYKKYGPSIFTRGLTMRLIHSSWHTAFVIGGGEIISDYYNSISKTS